MVVSLSCTLVLPGEFFKILMLGTTFRPIKSEPLGMETMALEFALESQGMVKSSQGQQCMPSIYTHSVVRLKSVMRGNFNLPKNKKCNCSLPISLQLCCGL